MWNDCKLAIRTLHRTPVFTLVAIASLALGIGANTAIFSLLDQILLRGLAVREPERLVVVHASQDFPGASYSDCRESVLSYPLYKDLRDRSRVFAGVVARGGATVSVSTGGLPEQARAELVSGNLFEVLGVSPVIGRVLTPTDDTPGAPAVALITTAWWQRRFGGAPSVIGQKMQVNGHPMIIVGVLPVSFRGLVVGNAPDLFVPIAAKRQVTPTWDGLDDRRVSWLTVFARLAPGVSAAQAEAATQAIVRPIIEDMVAQSKRPRDSKATRQFLATRFQLLPAAQGVNELSREFHGAIVALMSMVGVVLLIACANVAGLLTARAAGRRRELAIRLAVGASRPALLRQLLVESELLALVGGALGLIVGRWTVSSLLTLMGDEGNGVLSAAIDARALAFAAVLSAVVGVALGLVPAWQGTRTRVATALRDQAATVLAGSGQARFRQGLVVVQVALSLLLLIAAGLFARSVANLLLVDPGFRPGQVLTFTVDPALLGYPAPRVNAFFAELQRRVGTIPGVDAVGAANPGPLTNSNRGSNVTVEGYRPTEDENTDTARVGIGPGYLAAIGVPVRAGRDVSDRDMTAGDKIVLVNQAFARRYCGGRNPIGRHMTFGAGNKVVPDREIVGVVGDFKHGDLREQVAPTVFVPYTQEDRPDSLSFYVRTRGHDLDLAPTIRRIVADLDPNVAVHNLVPMAKQVADAMQTDRLMAVLAAAFGLLASVLAAVGLYGVIAFTVARRTAEIGVRIALGAGPAAVIWMVVREVAVLVAAGLAIGVPATALASRLVESQLFGVSGRDPLVFAAGVASLIIVGAIAGLVPARRAVAIDPIRALRCE